jgi:hypothetical protein
MNIFWLSRNPKLCAAYHCDKHAVKMILEYTQLLSTAIRVSKGTEVKRGRRHLYMMPGERLNNKGAVLTRNPNLYLATHINHPCSLWVRQSFDNWVALRELALAVCAEYTKRYGKVHVCEPMLRGMWKDRPLLPRVGKVSDPPQCMPDEYKRRSTVTAYRALYMGPKSRFAAWRYTKAPTWYKPKGPKK